MRFKKSGKSKPQLMDDEPTPVPGTEPEFVPGEKYMHTVAVDQAAKSVTVEVVGGDQIDAAQRIAAKVAKLLKKPRAPVADQLRIAHLALLAIAAGPKSVSRDIAVTALKVVTS